MGGGPAAEEPDRVLAAAAAVLNQHVADADEWCLGCLTIWGRLAPYPCLQAEWALAVRAGHDDRPGDAAPGQPGPL